jgi:hypothetical protein
MNKAHERSRHRFTRYARPPLCNGFNGLDWRDVRLEAVMRTKADMLPRGPLKVYGSQTQCAAFCADPLSSPISVNRMCQENAGAEQSHKRGDQFKHGTDS